MQNNPFLNLVEDDAQSKVERIQNNPFIELSIGREEVLRQKASTSLSLASKTNPVQAANAAKISKEAKVPMSLAERNFEEIKAWADSKKSENQLNVDKNPILAKRLQNLDFAKQAHDDIEALQNVERTFTGTLGDIGVTALKGAINLPEAVVGLVDIPTFGKFGKLLENVADFDEAKNILDEYYSPAQQAAQKRVQDAKGFMDSLGALVTNPSVIGTTVGESLPMMLGGMTAARGIAAKFPALAPWISAAIGEGVIGAGSAAEQIRNQTEDDELTLAQSAAALGTGLGTGLLGAAGGKVAQRLGIDDIDQALLRGGDDAIAAETIKQGFIGRVLGSGITEGFLEELPQSAQEQMWQNWALDKPLFEGVQEAAAMGLVSGGVTGGGFGAGKAVSQIISKGEENSNFINGLTEALDGSELAKRNPDEIEGFVEELSKDTDKENLYIEPETFVELLNQSGVKQGDLQKKVPTVMNQIAEALSVGSDIVIPTSTYAAHLANTDFGNAIQPYLKTDPLIPTQIETEQMKQAKEEMIETAKKEISEKTKKRNQFIESSRNVRNKVIEQLKDTKYTKTEARLFADYVQKFYETQAQRFDMMPEQMWDQYPIQITTREQFDIDTELYSQEGKIKTDSEAFKRWFGDSKVVDEEGNPLVVYHGSSIETIKEFDLEKSGTILKSDWGKGVYFTPDKWNAELYGTGALKQTDKEAIEIFDELNRVAKEYGTTPMMASIDLESKNPDAYKYIQELGDKFRDRLKEIETFEPPVYPVFLKIKNPFVYTYNGVTRPSLAEEVQGKGYDGLIIKDRDGDIEELIVFDPTQIKSIDNQGTFDPNDPNIYRQQSIVDLNSIKDSHSDLDIKVSENSNEINLSKIVVPDSQRGIGLGSSFMNDLISYADFVGKRIVLTPSKDFGATSVKRLKDFYKRFGFIENKGKKKNFEISESMYRNPQDKHLKQQSRAGFDPKSLTIILNPEADTSSFLHETAHAFLTIYADLASQENAPEIIRQEMQQLLDWFGVENIESWNSMTLEQQRDFHEQFAYNFELYLFEGKAPFPKLRKMFERFRNWLVHVYKDVRGEINRLYKQETGKELPILTTEVKQVMDRMVATQEMVEQAEKIHQMIPQFQTKEEALENGMDEATWFAYQELGNEATQEAIDQFMKSSMGVMQWMEGAKSKALKELQKKNKEKRKEVQKEIEEEVSKEKVYQIANFLKRGVLDQELGDVPQEVRRKLEEVGQTGETKLNLQMVREMYGPEDKRIEDLPKGRYGLLSNKGMNPELVASIFGYENAFQLVNELFAMEDFDTKVQRLTDERMIENYSDIATDEALNQKVLEAIHNQSRSRFIAVEHKLMTKSTSPVSHYTKASKEVALSILEKKIIKDIRPRNHELAEARASKESRELSIKNDLMGAIQAKRHQLLQNQLYKESIKAREDVSKSIAQWQKMFKSDKKMAKRREMNLVNLARALANAYGVGPDSFNAAEEIRKIDAYASEDQNPYLQDLNEVRKLTSISRPYKTVTYEEFTVVNELIQMLWERSKIEKDYEVAGEKKNIEDVEEQVVNALVKAGYEDKKRGKKGSFTFFDKATMKLLGYLGVVRKMESWIDSLDKSDSSRTMGKLIWDKVQDSLVEFREAREKYSTKLRNILSEIEYTKKPIYSESLDYKFKDKSEVVKFMLHTGNESNLRKLTLGYEWGTSTDGILDTSRIEAAKKEFFDKEIITESDMDAIQKIWDLNEEVKPFAQKAHKKVFGHYFKEVKASPVKTPWGDYPGGYVRATLGEASKNYKRIESKNALQQDFRNSMPMAPTGAFKSRIENFADRLSLDLAELETQITDNLLFAFVQPQVQQVERLFNRTGIFDLLNAYDPSIVGVMVKSWLNAVATQRTYQSPPNFIEKDFGKVVDYVRRNTGIMWMFGNIANLVQQTTGFAPAALRTGVTNIATSSAKYLTNPIGMTENVAKKSKFMDQRFNNMIFDISNEINNIVINPGFKTKMDQLGAKYGYIMQSVLQKHMDAIIWTAAFDKAIDENPGNEESAIKFADATIRLTQDALNPENLSAYQIGGPIQKAMTQFTGYFNGIGNLIITEFQKASRLPTKGARARRMAEIYMLSIFSTMVVAQLMSNLVYGDLEDKEDDGIEDEILISMAEGHIKGFSAMIPYWGPVINMTMNNLNDKPYDDKLSLAPAAAGLEQAVQGLFELPALASEEELSGSQIKKYGALMSIASGLPLYGLLRPIAYQADVDRGRVTPTSDIDYMRGLATGRASQASR